VPNTVLQYQWKDKIKEFFIEKNEEIEDLISFDLENIKKINILTYQAISGQDRIKRTKKNKVLIKKIISFFEKLKKIEVSSIVLDEAHHLTSWWSKVIFQLYVFLSTPTKSKDLTLSDELFFHLAKSKLEKELRPYVV
jgi:superfamily II DNA or RNA helicase